MILTENTLIKKHHLPRVMGTPFSVSSYSTLKPEMVSEADTQEMTKLLEVISVTDSEISTTSGEVCLVSPSAVFTGGGGRGEGRDEETNQRREKKRKRVEWQGAGRREEKKEKKDMSAIETMGQRR